MAGLQAHGHEEVSRSLGGGSGERGGFNLHEVAIEEHRAGYLIDARTHTNRVTRLGPAQIEVAVLEPDFIADGDSIIDRKRQRSARRQDDQVVRDDFHGTRRQFRILVSFGPDSHLAGHLDAELIAKRVRDCGLTHHDLGPTGRVTQVQERDPAMVTP